MTNTAEFSETEIVEMLRRAVKEKLPEGAEVTKVYFDTGGSTVTLVVEWK